MKTVAMVEVQRRKAPLPLRPHRHGPVQQTQVVVIPPCPLRSAALRATSNMPSMAVSRALQSTARAPGPDKRPPSECSPPGGTGHQARLCTATCGPARGPTGGWTLCRTGTPVSTALPWRCRTKQRQNACVCHMHATSHRVATGHLPLAAHWSPTVSCLAMGWGQRC